MPMLEEPAAASTLPEGFQPADVEKILEAKAEATESTDTTPSKTPGSDDVTPVAADAAPAKPAKDEETASNWLDAETKGFASAMGLTDDDLADFGSREELDRALRIIDRKAFEAGKAALGLPKQPAAPLETLPQRQQAIGDDPLADLARFKLGDQFDEEAAKPINDFMEAMAAEIKHLREFRSGLEQQQAESAFKALENEFTSSLDSLGHTDLFGKPGERTKEQAANVSKVFHEGHLVHAQGLLAQGRQPAPSPEFAKDAVNLLFGDQLIDKTKKQLTRKLRDQGNRRMGGGANKPVPTDDPRRKLIDKFNEMVENQQG